MREHTLCDMQKKRKKTTNGIVYVRVTAGLNEKQSEKECVRESGCSMKNEACLA